jgi:hypothetical protein
MAIERHFRSMASCPASLILLFAPAAPPNEESKANNRTRSTPYRIKATAPEKFRSPPSSISNLTL